MTGRERKFTPNSRNSSPTHKYIRPMHVPPGTRNSGNLGSDVVPTLAGDPAALSAETKNRIRKFLSDTLLGLSRAALSDYLCETSMVEVAQNLDFYIKNRFNDRSNFSDRRYVSKLVQVLDPLIQELAAHTENESYRRIVEVWKNRTLVKEEVVVSSIAASAEVHSIGKQISSDSRESLRDTKTETVQSPEDVQSSGVPDGDEGEDAFGLVFGCTNVPNDTSDTLENSPENSETTTASLSRGAITSVVDGKPNRLADVDPELNTFMCGVAARASLVQNSRVVQSPEGAAVDGDVLDGVTSISSVSGANERRVLGEVGDSEKLPTVEVSERTTPAHDSRASKHSWLDRPSFPMITRDGSVINSKEELLAYGKRISSNLSTPSQATHSHAQRSSSDAQVLSNGNEKPINPGVLRSENKTLNSQIPTPPQHPPFPSQSSASQHSDCISLQHLGRSQPNVLVDSIARGITTMQGPSMNPFPVFPGSTLGLFGPGFVHDNLGMGDLHGPDIFGRHAGSSLADTQVFSSTLQDLASPSGMMFGANSGITPWAGSTDRGFSEPLSNQMELSGGMDFRTGRRFDHILPNNGIRDGALVRYFGQDGLRVGGASGPAVYDAGSLMGAELSQPFVDSEVSHMLKERSQFVNAGVVGGWPQTWRQSYHSQQFPVMRDPAVKLGRSHQLESDAPKKDSSPNGRSRNASLGLASNSGSNKFEPDTLSSPDYAVGLERIAEGHERMDSKLQASQSKSSGADSETREEGKFQVEPKVETISGGQLAVVKADIGDELLSGNISTYSHSHKRVRDISGIGNGMYEESKRVKIA
ncbi:hypothetical protein HDU93_006530 [Gonapodya sp. JEL0774]|nr:hypothetical protein HDU93_006530 [Gonapodya sp. JEL0774]